MRISLLKFWPIFFAALAYGQGSQLPKYTVATLPSASGLPTYTVQVIDGISNSDCTVGGGTYNVLCSPHAGAWVPSNFIAGGITALTGDVTASGPGSAAATLATVNSNIGTCGDSTHVGQVTLNAKGLTTACTPVSISGGSGSGIIPSNATFAFVGTSMNDDDSNVLSTAVTLTAWSTSAGVTTVTNSGTNNFAAGQWISMRFATGWPAVPSYVQSFGTGYTLFQVQSSGLSSTQFKISTSLITAGSCASSCGSAYSAMSYLPFAATNSIGFPAGASAATSSFCAAGCTIAGTVTNYTALLHPISPAVTGLPGYLVINGPNNDLAICTAVATIESAYQSLFTAAHADNWVIVLGTPNSVNYSTTGTCAGLYTNQLILDSWLRGQGKSTVLAASPTSTAYWDILTDIGSVLNNGSDTTMVAPNGGLGPSGAKMAAATIASDLISGGGRPLSRGPSFYGLGTGSTFNSLNGWVFSPTVDGTWAYQWWNAARTKLEMAFDSANGGLIFPQSTAYLEIATTSCPGNVCLAGNHTYLDASGNYFSSGYIRLSPTNGVLASSSPSNSTFWNTNGLTTTPLSGMTASQVAIAATASTITSSKPIGGTGTGLASGPTSGTVAGDVVTYADTAGTQQDSGTLLSSLAPKASPTFTGTPAAPTATGGTNTTQLATTAFVQAAIAAAGTGAGIVTYSGPSLTFSGTLYFPIGGGGLSSTTETNVDIDSPAAVTIQNMTVQMSAAPGVGNSITYTWRKNASSTVLTCTISGASATSCSDTTHSFTTASLDLLDIQTVTTGTVVGTPTVVMAAQVGVAAAGGTAFSSLTGGTNTAAAMVVGSGASLAPGGSGTISANQLNGVPFCTGFTPTTGQNLQYTTASSPNPCYTAASAGSSGAWSNITGSVTVSGCSVLGGACAVSGSSTTAVTFSSIPGTYNALQIRAWGQSSNSGSVIQATYNSDSAAHYVTQGYYQTNTNTPTGDAAASQDFCNLGQFINGVVSQTVSDVLFYANTGFGKSEKSSSIAIGSISTLSANYEESHGCAWNQTSAITSVTLTISAGDYAAGTQFEILGQN